MYEFTKICLRKIIEHLEKNKEIDKITLITNSKLQYNFYIFMHLLYVFYMVLTQLVSINFSYTI